MATAGSIVVDLLMRTGSFETDSKRAEQRMKQMERQIDKTVRNLALAGAGAAAAFAAAMKNASSYMAGIGDAAERTSVSAQAFSELAYAAEQANLSQGELERVLRRSTEAINHAVAGTGRQAEALKTLGISAYDAQGNLKTSDLMLRDLAESFSKLEPGARKTGLVLDLFGQQLGQKVIPLLNGGADGLDEMALRARELGLVVDDEAAQAAMDFESNLDDLKKASSALAIALAKDLLPQVNEIITGFTSAAQAGGTFMGALASIESVFSSGSINSLLKEQSQLMDEITAKEQLLAGDTSWEWLHGQALRRARARLAVVQAEIEAWKELNVHGPHLPTSTLPSVKVSPDEGEGGSASTRTRTQVDAGQRLIDQMNERIALIGKETEYEKLLARISVDAITFRTEAQKNEALAMAQMLDEMEKAQQSAEAFKGLMHQLYPERQAADELAGQLATLQWAFEDGALAAQGYAEAINKVIEQSLEAMPEIQGLSVHITGGDAELERLEKEEDRLNEWYENQLAKLDEFRQQKAELTEEWDARELELKAQHEAAIDQIEHARQIARLSSTEAMFGELSGVAKAFAGEQSGIYKALFAVEKAYAVAKLMINAPKTASDAYSSVVGIPVVGPALAPVAAAAALAYQLGQIANVQAVGMAHDGIHSVPETGTWLLEKGERVLTSGTSARLDAMLERIERRQINEPIPAPAARQTSPVVNLIENPDRAGEVESRRDNDGNEELNIFVADIRGGGRRSQVLEATYGLQRVGR